MEGWRRRERWSRERGRRREGRDEGRVTEGEMKGRELEEGGTTTKSEMRKVKRTQYTNQHHAKGAG